MSELRDRVAERLASKFAMGEFWTLEVSELTGWASVPVVVNGPGPLVTFGELADEVLRIVAWNRARGNKPTTLPPGDWEP